MYLTITNNLITKTLLNCCSRSSRLCEWLICSQRALTRSGPLSGGAGEIQGFRGILLQELVDVLGSETGLLTDQEAAQRPHGHISPLHLQVHQQLLQHQQRLGQKREIVLPGSRRKSQQHLWKKRTKLELRRPRIRHLLEILFLNIKIRILHG